MLTFPDFNSKGLMLVRQMLPMRTHLGCVVQRHRSARLFQSTLHTGPVMEFITLSAPAEVFEEACERSL